MLTIYIIAFIVHLGITKLLLFVLSFIPSLVEIFENSFGISMLNQVNQELLRNFLIILLLKLFLHLILI